MTAERAGFVSLGAIIGDLLKDHPKRDLIMEGFLEARRLIESEGIDVARARLHADDEPIDLVCPRCQGVGWLRMDMEPGHADFGKILECQCGFVASRRGSIWPAASRIPAEYAHLDLTTYPDQRIASDIADWWHEPQSPWLLLSGDLGVGKTGLAIALVKKALAAGKSAVFRPFVELLSDIRATYRTHDGSTPDEADLLGACKGVDVLALDDIGAARVTGWAQERLFEILNHRYNERRRTILTTNLGPAEMEEYVGDRIYSRIEGMCWVYAIVGRNLRKTEGRS
jgi:DNA replication protein DnaC